MQTVLINLYGGPGSGKSTTAAHIFALLKYAGLGAELVREVAKEVVWEGLHKTPRMRGLHLFSQQAFKIEQLWGQVPVIISDSPLLLSSIYAKDTEPNAFHAMVRAEHLKYYSLDVFIKRIKEFSPRGRLQTEEEAIEKDGEILAMMQAHQLDFTIVDGDTKAADRIVKAYLSVKQFLEVESKEKDDGKKTT